MNQPNDPFNDALQRILRNMNNPQPPPPNPYQRAMLKAYNSLPRPNLTPAPSLPIRFAPPKTVRIVKPKVFVSFDYENDSKYKFLLSAWNKNSRFQFTFQDKTPQEIQTEAVDRVKAVLTTKVKEATYTLVIVGPYANQRHKDAAQIGLINWINYEIQQSNLYKRKVVAVRLQRQYPLPVELNNSQGYLVEGFNQAAIMEALAKLKEMK